MSAILRVLVAACLLSACGGEDDSPAPSGGAGGMLVSSGGMGGASGMIASGGAGGMIASGGTGGMIASGGAGGGSSAIPPTFGTFKSIVMQAPCFGAGCHNDEQNPLDLRMDDALYARLTARISTNCGQLPIVSPGKPEESALIKILKGPCGMTPRMPLGCVQDGDGACVPPEYIAALEQWIAMGAPQ